MTLEKPRLAELTVFFAVGLAAWALACSGSDGTGNPPGTGGSATGGMHAGTGGASTGGSAQTGGAPATGGVTPTGGQPSSGGKAGGGSAGTTTGGAGGSASGGTAGGATAGRGGAAAPTGGMGAGGTGQGGSTLPPVSDYAKPGPFTTTMQANTGPNGKYTMIRPQTLGQNGLLHAPIMFGPGTGMEVNQLSGLLSRIASHGFVILSARLDGGPGDPASKATMMNGLEWLLKQNTTAGSALEGKLDVKHAISMGYSVGGTAAVEIGGHEAVATVVSIHGHTATAALHGPLLQTSGVLDTVGLPLQKQTFAMSQVQTFLGVVSNADHGYIQGTHDGVPGGVETPAIIAWIRYWIYNDQGGKKYFYGDDCVMCQTPWTMPMRKNWP